MIKNKIEMLLSDAGYLFGNQIRNRVLHGQFVRTSAVAESNNYYTAFKRVDTHKYGIQLLHSVDAIKTTIGMTTGKVKTILERLFRKDNNNYKKILSLDTAEFYAFIINNEQKLKMEFREVTADMEQQRSFVFNPKKSIFHIPEQDFLNMIQL